MQKIPIRLAREGMILAQPVLDAEERVLMGEGVALTDSTIARLETAGIRTILIKGDPQAGPSGAQKVLDRLDHLFRKQEQESFMAAVKKMLIQYYNGKIEREKIGNSQ